MGRESAVTHWVDDRSGIQDNADKRFHIKALPGRRRGHRGRRDGRGMGRHGQRICQQWRRGLNETCRKEAAGR